MWRITEAIEWLRYEWIIRTLPKSKNYLAFLYRVRQFAEKSRRENERNKHYHAWDIAGSEAKFLGTWKSYETMDKALDKQPRNSVIINDVSPCICKYGVGKGAPVTDNG